MTDEAEDARHRREIADDSRDILSGISRLRELEERKRGEVMSSERFHELATEVTETARQVWEAATAEEQAGDELSETQDVTTNDVARGA